MRRKNEQIKKLRVKVIEDRKNGFTYEDIRKKRGVSPSTIAKWTQGKDLKRYCKLCGETDPEKLEEHHPDKERFPNYTVTLCANCHSKITRKQLLERRKRQEKVTIPKTAEALPPKVDRTPVSTRPTITPLNPANSSSSRQFTPEEQRQIIKWGSFAAGGVAIGEAIFDKRLPWWVRLIIGGGSGLAFWLGGKINPNPDKQIE